VSKLRIEGPNQVFGEIEVRGAKNAVLPALVAAAAGNARTTLHNVPTSLNDVTALLEALDHLGCRTECSDGSVVVDGSTIHATELPGEISGRLRYSLLLLGLLAGRHGHAKIHMPGGCDLGERKFDLHLHGLQCLGAQVELSEESIEVSADRLVGADINFYLPTTTGTETIMLAACFAEGRTRIFNANTRPEIVAMGECLNAMGANVSVRNRVVEVEGGRELTSCTHSVMPAWDEALTYILTAGITGGEVCIRDFDLNWVKNDVAYLRESGMSIFEWGGNVYASAKNIQLQPFDLFTAPYPGVNSDMQPLFTSYASRCRGESTVTDQRFAERFQYVSELQKLGVPVESYGNCAVIRGPKTLRGAEVRALDLRCGAALIMGGLAAEGTTTIDNIYQIERGYEHIDARMRALGADIERFDE
jgi:UDP-N-acetylglucosamine 1-carboxyvinyltransferase